MRGFYPVSQVVELAAGWRDTTKEMANISFFVPVSLSEKHVFFGRTPLRSPSPPDHASRLVVRPGLTILVDHPARL